MRFKTPPSSSEIDWRSPQAKGLRIWFSSLIAQRYNLRDPVSKLVATLESGAVQQLTTDLGYCYYINEDSQTTRVDIANDALLDITEPLTLSAWCMLEQYSGGTDFGHVICRPTTAVASPYIIYRISINNQNPASFVCGFSTGDGGTAHNITGASTITLNKPYHVCMTYDGAVLILYVNGKIDATAAKTAAVGTNNKGVALGRLGDHDISNNHWHGWIQDARIYNRALNANEVWRLYDPDTRWDLYKLISSKIFPSPAAAQQILLNTLNISSIANPILFTPGEVSIPLDTLSVNISGIDLSVTIGAISILLDSLSLSSNIPSVSITPDAISIPMNTLNLLGSANDILVQLGDTTITLSELILLANAQTITISTEGRRYGPALQ